MKNKEFKFLFVFCVFSLWSCASTRLKDRSIDDFYESGNLQDAIDALEGRIQSIGQNDEDLLLYYLDLAIVYRDKKDYRKSNEFFKKAEQLAKLSEFIDASEEISTLLVSDLTKVYRGELFEKIAIHNYMALNYQLLASPEAALVESKLVHRAMDKIKKSGESIFEISPWAYLLSALSYEYLGYWDDARIDYSNAYRLMDSDLFLNKKNEMEKNSQHSKKNQRKSEILVVFENGLAPVKRENPEFHSLPKYYSRWNPVQSLQVFVNGKVLGKTQVIENYEELSFQNLNSRLSAMERKKAFGALAKVAAGYGVAQLTKSTDLGILAGFLLFAFDQADLRSWKFLPKEIQFARFALPPGDYAIELRSEDGTWIKALNLTLKPNEWRWLNYRFVQP